MFVEENVLKEEIQRFLIEEARRGNTEIEAYRNLMKILNVEFPAIPVESKSNLIFFYDLHGTQIFHYPL